MCTSGHPYGIIADLNHTWVTTDPEVAIFGYVCVISKVHAVEPFDLPDQGAAFWQEAMAVAQVVNRLYRPVKLNYEIHGNTLPHLHMHLFPRQPDDGFVGRPIDLVKSRYPFDTAVSRGPRNFSVSQRGFVRPRRLRDGKATSDRRATGAWSCACERRGLDFKEIGEEIDCSLQTVWIIHQEAPSAHGEARSAGRPARAG